MVVSTIQSAFSAGEISPGLYGRVDYKKYSTCGTTLRNVFCNYRGGAYSRPGTAYVLRSQTPVVPGLPGPRVITFQFSISQGYAIEIGALAGAGYMRFYLNGAPVVEAPKFIGFIQRSNPCVIAAPANGYSNGEYVAVSGVNGMEQLNGRTFLVTVIDVDHFSISNLNGQWVDSTAYTPYVSGGQANRVYQIGTPWAITDIAALKFTESADVMSITHPSYRPYDLKRITNNNWTLTPVTFVATQIAPGQPNAVATVQPNAGTSPPTLPCAYAYVVTAIDVNGNESIASPIVNVLNSVDMAVTAGSIIVTWPAAVGAVRYNVYRAPPSYNTGTVDPGGVIVSSTVGIPGTGYVVGDTGNITGGDGSATYQIASVGGLGDVISFAVPGTGHIYAVNASQATVNGGSQPGIGTGFTVNILAVTGAGTSTQALPVPIGAVFSYVGSTSGTQFIDSNILSDTTISPPQHVDPFAPGKILLIQMTGTGGGYTTATPSISSGTGSGFIGACVIVSGGVSAVVILNAGQNYMAGDSLVITGDGGGAVGTLTIGPQTGTFPGLVAYYQQRRVYAATNNNPDTYFMSRPGDYLNFDVGFPVNATDAITGTPWAQQVNGIQWMVQMPGGLITFTGKGAWQVTGQGGSGLSPAPITPASQQAQQVMFNGIASLVPPLAINFDLLYVQSKGAKVLDATYNFFTNNYTGTDQTILSGHLFLGYDIAEWAWCEEPYKVVWAVRCDGVLLSFTYMKEQEVYGWARHDTQGQFKSVCSVTEPPVDALYCVVQRQTHFGPAYFIERFDNRIWATTEDPWCVDCALEYPQRAPGVGLTGVTTGTLVDFTADAPAFTASSVGSVLRIAGGIARILTYTDSQHIHGQWVLLPTQTVPASTAFLICEPTDWTITQPTPRVYGLDHLAGQVVVGLLDGIPMAPLTVGLDGQLLLPIAASSIKLGLAFTVRVQTPYLDVGSPTVQGRRKDITGVTIRVDASAVPNIGSNQPDGGAQVPVSIDPPWLGLLPGVTQNPNLQPGTYVGPSGNVTTKLFSGDFRANITPDWNERGQVAIEQTLPLPLAVTAAIVEVLDGDVPEQTYSEKQYGRDQQQPAKPRPPGIWMLRA